MADLIGGLTPEFILLVRAHRESQGLGRTFTPEQLTGIENVLDREIHRRGWGVQRSESPNRADRGNR